MTITTNNSWKLAIAVLLAIFLACYLITLSPVFVVKKTLLSHAIIIDLLITAPLAWLFVIRKSAVSKLTVIRVFVVGLLFAGIILDAHTNVLLSFIKTWLSPFIEATILFIVGSRFYNANKKARDSGEANFDFLIYSRHLMHQFIGNEKAGNIISSEIAVLYYAFIAGKNKNIDYKTTFSIYKENGILLVLGAILFLFLVESTAVHFLLSLWNPTGAWILTGLSFYTCLQLYGHMKAIKARAVSLDDDCLKIHNGLAGDAFIGYDNIQTVEMSNKIPVGRMAIKIALIKGLENHNCVICLKKPIYVTKIFGIKKRTDTVLFFVDRPKDFAMSVHLRMHRQVG